MREALFRLFRFFVTEFGIAAFLTILHFLLVILYWFYPHAQYSSWLLIPDTFFKTVGFPDWWIYVGALFFICGAGRILCIIFGSEPFSIAVSLLSVVAWVGAYFIFQGYYLIYGKLPVSEWYFCTIVIYANAMLFMRQCLGYKIYFKMGKDETEKPSISI